MNSRIVDRVMNVPWKDMGRVKLIPIARRVKDVLNTVDNRKESQWESHCVYFFCFAESQVRNN